MNQLSGEISKGIGAEATQDKALGRGSEVGPGCALSAGDRGDAGGWRPDQGGRQNEPWGFCGLDWGEVGKGLAALQLLRSGSRWLLVTSSTGRAGSQKPGGGAQGDGGSRSQAAKDR